MEASIQLLFAIAFVILGLSHSAQPKAWISLFHRLTEQGEAGVLRIALITFPPGLLIVVFHPVWAGIPLILTLIGWGYIAKATLYFLFPRIGLRVVAGLREEHVLKLRWLGAGLSLVGGLLAWELWTTP